MAITVTIQPDGTVGKDTFIHSSAATTNYGTGAYLTFGAEAGDIASALIDFKLRDNYSYLKKSLILSAILSLYTWSADARHANVPIGHCLRNWVENEANWNVYSTGNNWQTAGGLGAADREVFISNICAIQYVAGQEIQMPIPHKEIIRQIVDPAVYGFILTNNFTTTTVLVCSSDNTTAAYRPKLTIVYEPYHKIFPISAGLGQVR